MKKLLVLLFFLCPQLALAQAPTKICVESTDGRSCVEVSTTAPFPVTVTGGGGGGSPTAGAGAQPYNFTPLTPDQFNLGVVASTALTIPTGSLQAVVCAAAQAVNYTYDGTTTPTASVGMPLLAGQCIQFSGATVLTNLRFIQVAATATLNVSYTK